MSIIFCSSASCKVIVYSTNKIIIIPKYANLVYLSWDVFIMQNSKMASQNMPPEICKCFIAYSFWFQSVII